MKQILQLLLLFSLTAECNNVYSQLNTYNSTTINSETMLGTVVSNTHINCANITYSYSSGGNGQLGVICWDAGNGGGAPICNNSHAGFIVFDDASNTLAQCTFNSFTPVAADVAIGNGVTSGGHTSYRVAFAVETNAGDIKVDIWEITGAGVSLSANNIGTMTAATHGGGVTYHHPRIDIMEEAGLYTTLNNYAAVPGTATPLGLPNCSKFVVTYDDNNGNIYGYTWNVNFYGSSTSTTITPTGLTTFSFPDVAAIQIDLSGMGSTPQDFARFTWVDNNGSLYYGDWNIATTATNKTLKLNGTATTTSSYCEPRIDAIDDYTINNQGMGWANYQVVANEYNTGVMAPLSGENIAGFNDAGPYTFYSGGVRGSLSSTLLDNSVNSSACVAAGPIGGASNYTIGCHTGYGSGTGGVSAFSVDMTTGLWNGTTINQVNNSPAAGSGSSPCAHRMPMCVSASCNDQGYLLVAYNYNLTDLYYKYSADPLTFKPGKNSTNNNALSFSMSPNPAQNSLILNGAKGNYTITEITGKLLLRGTLTSQVEKLDISMLNAGTYILNITTDKGCEHTKFIKN